MYVRSGKGHVFPCIFSFSANLFLCNLVYHLLVRFIAQERRDQFYRVPNLHLPLCSPRNPPNVPQKVEVDVLCDCRVARASQDGNRKGLPCPLGSLRRRGVRM